MNKIEELENKLKEEKKQDAG
jgi:hypothetical protein